MIKGLALSVAAQLTPILIRKRREDIVPQLDRLTLARDGYRPMDPYRQFIEDGRARWSSKPSTAPASVGERAPYRWL